MSFGVFNTDRSIAMFATHEEVPMTLVTFARTLVSQAYNNDGSVVNTFADNSTTTESLPDLVTGLGVSGNNLVISKFSGNTNLPIPQTEAVTTLTRDQNELEYVDEDGTSNPVSILPNIIEKSTEASPQSALPVVGDFLAADPKAMEYQFVIENAADTSFTAFLGNPFSAVPAGTLFSFFNKGAGNFTFTYNGFPYTLLPGNVLDVRYDGAKWNLR